MFDDKFQKDSGLSRDELLRLARLSAGNVDDIAGKLHSIEKELQYQRELLSTLNEEKERPSGDVKSYGEKIRAVRVEVTRLEDEFNKLYKEALDREKECDSLEEVARYLGVNDTYRKEPRLAPRDGFVEDLYEALHKLPQEEALPLIQNVLGKDALEKKPQSFYDDVNAIFNSTVDDGAYLTKQELIKRLKNASEATDSIIRSLHELEKDLNRQKELLSYLDRADGVTDYNKAYYEEARRQVENNIKTLEDEFSEFASKIKTVERQLDIYQQVASWLGNNDNYRTEERLSALNTDIDDEVADLKMRLILPQDEFEKIHSGDGFYRTYVEDDYDKISLPEFFARIKEISKTADVYAKKIHDLEKEIEREKEILSYLNSATNITPENKEEYEHLRREIPKKIKRLTWELECLRPKALKAEFDADVYEKVARWLGDDTVYRKEKRIAEVGAIDEAVESLKKRIRQDGFIYKGSFEDYKKGYIQGYSDAEYKYKNSTYVKEEEKVQSLSSIVTADNSEEETVEKVVEKVVKKHSPFWIVLSLLFLALLGGSIGYYQGYVVKNYNTKVDNLNTDVNNLNSNIDTLNNNVDSLNRDVDTRDSKISVLEENIESLRGNLDTLTKENEDLKSERDILLGNLDKEGEANTELLKNLAELQKALSESGEENMSLSELIKRAEELRQGEKASSDSEDSSVSVLPGTDDESTTDENIWAIRHSLGLSIAPYGINNYSNITLDRNILSLYGFGATLDYRMNFKYMFWGIEGGASWFIGDVPFTQFSALLKVGGIIPINNISLEPYIGLGLNFSSSYGYAPGFGFSVGFDIAFNLHENISLSLGAALRGGFGYNSYNDKVFTLDFHIPRLTLNVLF